MNRVDHMIKYLAGDLNREESKVFEAELEKDKQLRNTFDQVSRAYRLVEDQLRYRDEEAFLSKLREIMDASEPGVGTKKRRRRWIYLLPLAASMAILLAIYIMNRDPGRVFLAFFHPADDPVLLAYTQDTRGASRSAIAHFSQAEYRACLDKTAALLKEDPGNQLVLLFHLLAAMELDEEAGLLFRIEEADIDTGHAVGQSLTWYHALALVKSGRPAEAAILLEGLLSQPGPYESDAHKLQKILKK